MSKSSPIDDQDKVLMDDLNKKLDDLNSAYSLTMDAKILLMDYIVSLKRACYCMFSVHTRSSR